MPGTVAEWRRRSAGSCMARPVLIGSPHVGRAGRLTLLIACAAILVGACGGTAGAADDSGAGGGAANPAYDAVIAKIGSDFGTSMIAAEAQGDTLKITIVNGAGTGMAGLFMCAYVEPDLKAAGLDTTTKVVIVDQTGTQLATEAVCKP